MIVIIVEGETDACFLCSYINYLDLGCEDVNFEFMILEGDVISRRKELRLFKQANAKKRKEFRFVRKKGLEEFIRQADENVQKVIAIVDADNKREEYLKILKTYPPTKNIFYFPDNNSSGNLENLIKGICLKREFLTVNVLLVMKNV